MILKDIFQSLDRRTFLKLLSITGIAALVEPRRLVASLAQDDLSRLIFVENKAATTGFSINAGVVQEMVNDGITVLANIPDIGEAWKSLLPGITPVNTIGIKVNCFNSLMPAHPEVTYAVANSLKKMYFGTGYFPENNIIIYDVANMHLRDSGYTINTSDTGVRCFGTIETGIGYSAPIYDVNGIFQGLSNILVEMIDYLINISVLKNHGLAGATLCLKNHYGTTEDPDYLHGNFCDPYIPALNALPPIRDKQHVNILDALFGIYEGGPMGSPQFISNMLVMSMDPVAVDFWGRELLKVYGAENLERASYIDTATQAPYSLGTNDPTQMDIITVSGTIVEDTYPEYLINRDEILLPQNHPNPFSRNTQIRFHLSRTEHVDVTIFDVSGRRVRGLLGQTLGAGWHTARWDGHNDAGHPVSSGIYFCLVRTKRFKKSISMHVLR
jgi:uncharacterized protein (DUF362 family)